MTPKRVLALDPGTRRVGVAVSDPLGITAQPKVPLVGMVTRLTRQKGIDLLFDTLPQLLRQRDFRFVALGSGEPRYERFMHDLQLQFP
jgi:starch synthase